MVLEVLAATIRQGDGAEGEGVGRAAVDDSGFENIQFEKEKTKLLRHDSLHRKSQEI